MFRFFLSVAIVVSTGVQASENCMSDYIESRVGEEFSYSITMKNINAQGVRQLEKNEVGEYLFKQSATVLIASIEESSQFVLKSGDIVPRYYKREQKGLGAKLTSIDYSEDKAEVIRKGRESHYDLPHEFQDPQTSILALQAHLYCGADTPITFNVAGTKGSQQHVYHRIDSETAINHREGLSVEYWERNKKGVREVFGFIPERAYLLMLFEQNDDGDINRLELLSDPE